jgi:hypothetical protein
MKWMHAAGAGSAGLALMAASVTTLPAAGASGCVRISLLARRRSDDSRTNQ